MNPRPPYSMSQLASEIATLDSDATFRYEKPDGLGVYQELWLTSPRPDEWLDVLSRVSGIDRRIQYVEVQPDDTIVAGFTASGGRWTRDRFHLTFMWEAVADPETTMNKPDPEPTPIKVVKKAAKKVKKKAEQVVKDVTE